MFKWPVFGGTGFKLEFLGEKELSSFIEKIYGTSTLDQLTPKYWLDLYDEAKMESMCQTFEDIFEDTFIIGFELPVFYKKYYLN